VIRPNPDDSLPSWNPGSTKQAIVDFVAAVTDSRGPDFVLPVDRVAVFDNDGTPSTETPCYTQIAFAIDRSAELGQPVTLEDLRAGGRARLMELVAVTHGSITTEEFAQVCRRWMASASHPVTGRPFSAMVYQPMLELLGLLQRNEFDCWILSGGGTDFMRTWAPDAFGLAPHRFIGSLGTTTFEMGRDGPELVKGSDLQVLDDGVQKPVCIHQHIGQRPIFAAGNTDGDLPMLQWTASNPLRTLQLAVHHTDDEREFAYDTDPLLGAGTAGLLRAATGPSWATVDMAADWSSVFPAST
jgi:hypothetical protein